ncbi:hypothetical protein GBA52_001891 [Prunus armeniaca]|nr:hypothetical protein GBA52_001891 [Prunus armeniaca]
MGMNGAHGRWFCLFTLLVSFTCSISVNYVVVFPLMSYADESLALGCLYGAEYQDFE